MNSGLEDTRDKCKAHLTVQLEVDCCNISVLDKDQELDTLSVAKEYDLLQDFCNGFLQ